MRSKQAQRPSETQEQSAVIAWWDAWSRTKGLDPRLLLSIPNGAVLAGDARARAMQMNKLKRTGLRPGVPDLFLALGFMFNGRLAFNGLFVEMKSAEGKISTPQREYIELLRGSSFNVIVALGAGEGIRAIKAYVGAALNARY